MNDYISRQGAIDALRVAYWDDNIQSAKDDSCIVDAMTDWAIRQVKALPSAQQEQKRGRWVKISPANIYECSKCGKNVMTNDISEYNFCHGCGADMRGDDNEID